MAEQLIKKTGEGYSNVMPKSWIEAITDKSTGESLTHILQGFNMYFLSYTGNTEQTRCQVPKILRKKGLWITYVKYDSNVYTEWYNSNNIDDKSWGNSSNWRIGNNELVGDLTISANGNWVINGNETEFRAVGENGNTPILRVANNRLQVSYDTGNTYHNVDNNPVYTQIRTYNNKLQISTDLGANWIDASDEIAAYFRFNSGQGNNVGNIQISRNNKDWSNLSGNFVNNLHISKYIGANETLPTSGIAEGTIYAKGPTYAESDTSHNNPIYRLWVYAYKGNTLAWQDNGEFASISAGVVQELGDSESLVISQKCISDNISKLNDKVTLIDTTINGGVIETPISFKSNARLDVTLEQLDAQKGDTLYIRWDGTIGAGKDLGIGYLTSAGSSTGNVPYFEEGNNVYRLELSKTLDYVGLCLYGKKGKTLYFLKYITNSIISTINGINTETSTIKGDLQSLSNSTAKKVEPNNKNIWVNKEVARGWFDNYGNINENPSSTSLLNTELIPVNPNTQYIVPQFQLQGVRGFDKNKSFTETIQLITTGSFSYKTFITGDNTYYIRIGFKDTNDYNNAILQQGAEPSVPGDTLLEEGIKIKYLDNGIDNINTVLFRKKTEITQATFFKKDIPLKSIDITVGDIIYFKSNIVPSVAFSDANLNPISPINKIVNIGNNTYFIKVTGSTQNQQNIVNLRIYNSIGKDDYIEIYGRKKNNNYLTSELTLSIETKKQLMSACGFRRNNNSNLKTDFQMLIMTDTHGDALAERRAVDYANTIDSIDCIIHCGDIVAGNFAESSTKANWLDNFNRATKPYYVVVGNHDVGNSTNPSICATHTESYNTWIKPIIDKGYVIDEEHIGENNYYYHDFTNYKVRLIVVYEYDGPLEQEDGRYKILRGIRYINQEQCDWFANTIASTPDGYGIIVAMHNPFAGSAKSQPQMKFSQSDTLWSGSDAGQYNNGSDFYAEIVHAYVNRINYSGTFDSVTVTKDFSSCKGTFMCFIGGHVHRDIIWKHENYGLIGITPVCSTNSYVQAKDSDIRTDEYGEYANSLTVLSTDIDHKKIRLVRIGMNITDDGEYRDYETIKV